MIYTSLPLLSFVVQEIVVRGQFWCLLPCFYLVRKQSCCLSIYLLPTYFQHSSAVALVRSFFQKLPETAGVCLPFPVTFLFVSVLRKPYTAFGTFVVLLSLPLGLVEILG